MSEAASFQGPLASSRSSIGRAACESPASCISTKSNDAAPTPAKKAATSHHVDTIDIPSYCRRAQARSVQLHNTIIGSMSYDPARVRRPCCCKQSRRSKLSTRKRPFGQPGSSHFVSRIATGPGLGPCMPVCRSFGGLVVLAQEIPSEIPVEVAPYRMNVVAAVL